MTYNDHCYVTNRSNLQFLSSERAEQLNWLRSFDWLVSTLQYI